MESRRRSSGSKLRFIAPLCFAFALTMPWLSAGCGGASASSFCDAQCSCQGCSQTARQTCETNIQNAETTASNAGCGAQASALLSCSQEKAECTGTSYVAGNCPNELGSLTTCLSTVNCTLTFDPKAGLKVTCPHA